MGVVGRVARPGWLALPQLESMASRLHERAPREVPVLPAPPAMAPLPSGRRPPALHREVLPGTQAVEPTHLLSNGRYHVALRGNGAGHSLSLINISEPTRPY